MNLCSEDVDALVDTAVGWNPATIAPAVSTTGPLRSSTLVSCCFEGAAA